MCEELSAEYALELRNVVIKGLIDSGKVGFGSYPNDGDFRLQYGSKLRRLRFEQNLGLNYFASHAGVDPGYLSRIERGKRAPPLKTLYRIADALNVSRLALATETGYIIIDRERIEDWELELFRLFVDTGNFKFVERED
jgi:transcriptional regulator with XRE-family HTH domain